MTRPAASRKVGGYLVLVAVGSVAVALVAPRSTTAPLLSAVIPVIHLPLILLTTTYNSQTWHRLAGTLEVSPQRDDQPAEPAMTSTTPDRRTS